MVTLIGSGWDEYIGQFKEQHDNKESILFINNKFPEAEFISQLALEAFESGELRSIEEAQPVYLRNNVAEKSKKQI